MPRLYWRAGPPSAAIAENVNVGFVGSGQYVYAGPLSKDGTPTEDAANVVFEASATILQPAKENGEAETANVSFVASGKSVSVVVSVSVNDSANISFTSSGRYLWRVKNNNQSVETTNVSFESSGAYE